MHTVNPPPPPLRCRKRDRSIEVSLSVDADSPPKDFRLSVELRSIVARSANPSPYSI